jgi:hypothetical protein
MLKISALLKKFALAALVLAIALAAFPLTGASAASLNAQTTAQPNYPRLEKIWAREQAIYNREDKALSNASTFINKVQALLDNANAKGLDTSAIQAALNALSAVIPTVQAAHARGAVFIASHAGFDASGIVTDRTTATASAKSLAQVLKDTRTAMNGTLKALHEAVKAFSQAHPHSATAPSSAPSITPSPTPSAPSGF